MSKNHFEQYPLLLKYTDIMDMLQVGSTKAYSLMRDFTAETNVKSRHGEKSIRVPRDKFVTWLLQDQTA